MNRWQRLGNRVRDERARRFGTRAAFARASGLSASTIDSIEYGRKKNYAPETLAAIEAALDWGHGSIDRVLKGMEPIPVEDPDLAVIIARWPNLTPGQRRMLRVLATEGDETT